MKPRPEKTPTYIAEFEVGTTSKERSVLRSRLEAGRQLYNAVLGETMSRLGNMRKDIGFAVAKAMHKPSAKKAAFTDLREKHGFREYDLHKLSSLSPNSWLRGHLDDNTAQKVATRAFKDSGRYLGEGGRRQLRGHINLFDIAVLPLSLRGEEEEDAF
jgi:hypothetical protein